MHGLYSIRVMVKSNTFFGFYKTDSKQQHKVSVDDVISAICRLPEKSCAADTLPAPQLKLVADLIAQFLTELFNCSLSTANVPEVFKSALTTPLLKKPDLDSADPRFYRPIYNLSVVSKLLERIVFRQQSAA